MKMDHRYLEKNKSYYAEDRTEILDFIDKPVKTTLDVGCSSGNFSVLLIKNKFCEEAHGIEPFEDAYNTAKEKINKVYHATVEDAIPLLQNKYYDIIFFNDVLEHLINPEEVLLKIKSKLSPNGKIISSIPNVRFIHNLYSLIIYKDWRYQNSGILDKTHLRFFTKKSIIRMFEECGFDIIKCEGNPKGKVKLSKKVKLFNFLLNGALNNTEYQQFITVCQLKK